MLCKRTLRLQAIRGRSFKCIVLQKMSQYKSFQWAYKWASCILVFWFWDEMNQTFLNIFRENLPKKHHECSYDPRTHTRSASKETNSHQTLSSRSLNQQTSPLKTTIQSMKTSLGITYSRVPLICSTVFSLVLTFYPLTDSSFPKCTANLLSQPRATGSQHDSPQKHATGVHHAIMTLIRSLLRCIFETCRKNSYQ